MLLLGLASSATDVLDRKRVSVLPLQSQQFGSLREQVEVPHQGQSIELLDLCEFLQNVVHIFRNLGSEVDVRSPHDGLESLSELDLLDGHIELEVNSILEPHLWIVQQSELLIIRFLPQVLLVELVHTPALSTQTLQDVDSGLIVNQTKSSDEVKFPILLFLL